jgi:outer membrane protein OmpA-like peptidoglycan-associated protein
MRSERYRITWRAISFVSALVGCAVISLWMSACVFVRSSTIGQTTGAGSAVSASHSDYGILLLSEPQGLTAAAHSELAKQCPSGLLTDVQTQLSVRDWFFIVQYYTVDANAICKPPPPPPPPPLPPAAPPKIILRGVHFDFNRAQIRPVDTAVLDEAVAKLKDNPNMRVNVNAYCDSIGGDAYNLKLSEKRATAVVDYLEKDGIPADRLSSHGYGKTNFIASNETKEGRAQNRRVELVPQE